MKQAIIIIATTKIQVNDESKIGEIYNNYDCNQTNKHSRVSEVKFFSTETKETQKIINSVF